MKDRQEDGPGLIPEKAQGSQGWREEELGEMITKEVTCLRQEKCALHFTEGQSLSVLQL